MRWAQGVGISFHPDWHNATSQSALALGEEKAEARPPAAPTLDLKTKEQESLLKMVVGMAIGAYRWDPRARRNDVTSEIESDLARAGVPLDPDTIRKWLRKGAELIPPQEEP
jgi:hypothetical protein